MFNSLPGNKKLEESTLKMNGLNLSIKWPNKDSFFKSQFWLKIRKNKFRFRFIFMSKKN